MKFPSFGLKLRARFINWLCNNEEVSNYFFGKYSLSVLNRQITKLLISRFDGNMGHLADQKKGELGFGLIHYSLISVIKPKKVLCVGSRKGYIPAICALACKENGVGSVDFVDAGFGEENVKNWSGIGWWKKVDPFAHFALLKINKYLTPYIMETNEYAKKYKEKKYDYIYIDGDHSYKGVKQDWELFWPKLRKGGFMVFHDVTVRQTKSLGKFGVWRLWKEISKKNSIEFPFPSDSGLGILQKK